MKYTILLFLGILFFSCNDSNNVDKEIQNIPMEVEIVRFDKDFAQATPADLPKLKKEYPEFFPEQFHDSIWIEKLTDTLQIELENEVIKAFPKDQQIEDVIVPLFRHIKYYFPKFEVPKVITTTSDVDYRNKVIAAQGVLVIGLDNYLGSEHYFYDGIERYIAKEMKPARLGPDVAEAYAQQFVQPPRNAAFLDQIIYFGKLLYLKDLWLPNTSDADKIGYTEEEYEWAEENELYMWRYFIESEILYSTDPKLGPRFIHPAPFSKFYLEIDNESPGMLGQYLGWKIVRAYMKNNSVEIQGLMVADADEIFKNSKYKPKK